MTRHGQLRIKNVYDTAAGNKKGSREAQGSGRMGRPAYIQHPFIGGGRFSERGPEKLEGHEWAANGMDWQTL